MKVRGVRLRRIDSQHPDHSTRFENKTSLMVFDRYNRQNIKYKYQEVECPEPVEGQWFMYLLECKDNSLYCGSTDNLIRRIHDHNSGIAAQWTKMRKPVQLVYFEIWESLLLARRRELQIKGWSYLKKSNLINGMWGKSK